MKARQPLVSILIPAYNAERWIADAINSVLAQTWQNTEVIVVDDGSVDDTLTIAEKFSSRHIKVLTQENRGASAARNSALRQAQGDFVQYLDADDLLAPDKIEHQLRLLLELDTGFIASGAWARFYESPAGARFNPELVWGDYSPIDWLICAWEGGGMMSPAAWLLPRKVIDTAGTWDESLSLNDDGEYFCRVILASEGVRFCPEAKSFYRSGIDNSLSARRTRAAHCSALRSCELCSDYLLAEEDTERTRRACAALFERFIYETDASMSDLVERADHKARMLGGGRVKIGGSLYRALYKTVGGNLTKRAQRVYSSLKSHQ